MRVIGALVAVIALSSPVAADNTADTSKQADELFLAGRDLVGKEQYAAACDKFKEAQKLQPNNVAILLNLGQCNEKQGKLGSALRWYRKTLIIANETKDESNAEYISTAQERTSSLAGVVAKITFDISNLQPGAVATIDGDRISPTEPTFEVDKGPHTVEARLAGKKTSSEQIVVEADGKLLNHTFKPLEDAPIVGNRRRRRLMGAVIGGSVIFVTTVATGIWANGIQSDFDKEVGMGNDPGKKKEIKDRMLAPSLVFAGGVAVGLGIAAYFFFTAPPGERQEEALPKTAFTPTVDGDSVGFSMFRRF